MQWKDVDSVRGNSGSTVSSAKIVWHRRPRRWTFLRLSSVLWICVWVGFQITKLPTYPSRGPRRALRVAGWELPNSSLSPAACCLWPVFFTGSYLINGFGFRLRRFAPTAGAARQPSAERKGAVFRCDLRGLKAARHDFAVVVRSANSG